MDPSPPAPPEQTCFHHAERSTGRHCTRCGRPACSDCLRQASVGSHCWQCVRAAAPPRGERRRVQAALGVAGFPVTRLLVGTNVVLFVIGVLLDGSLRSIGRLQQDFGLWGPAIDINGEWFRIFTSGFLHAGLFHLGLNMLALWILGQSLEPALGPTRFAALYLTALAAGSFGALLLEPLAVTVGASGAIYGLMGAMFTGMRARGHDPFANGIGGLLLVNLLITFLIPGISIGGHLGGLVAGGALGWLMLRPGSRTVEWAPASAALLAASAAGGLWAAAQWPGAL